MRLLTRIIQSFLVGPLVLAIFAEWYQFFIVVVLVLVVIFGSFSAFVLYKALKAQKKPVLEFIGEIGLTIDEIGPQKEGFIRLNVEYWKALSKSVIKPNRKVKILAREGSVLIVEPLEEGTISRPEKPAGKSTQDRTS